MNSAWTLPGKTPGFLHFPFSFLISITYIINIVIIFSGFFVCFFLSQEHTEAQRGVGTCPRSHRKFVLEPRLADRLPDCLAIGPPTGLSKRRRLVLMPNAANSPRACFYDAGCRHNNAIPFQTHTSCPQELGAAWRGGGGQSPFQGLGNPE